MATRKDFDTFLSCIRYQQLDDISLPELEIYTLTRVGKMEEAFNAYAKMETERRDKIEQEAQIQHATKSARYFVLLGDFMIDNKSFCMQKLYEGYFDLLDNAQFLHIYDDDLTKVYRLICKEKEPNPLQELFILSYEFVGEFISAKSTTQQLYDLHRCSTGTLLIDSFIES
jgi:hypothetical protein